MSGVPAWLSKWGVTRGGTWADHLARGSAGGVDYGAPVGTDILSPSDGVVSFRYFADKSSVIRVTRPDGTATEFLHGSLVGSTWRTVKNGEHIGESGGAKGMDGAGPSTGAHIHVHDVTATGKRVQPFSTITGTAPAGGEVHYIQEDDLMAYALKLIAAHASLPQVPAGAIFIGQGTDPLVWVSNAGPEILLGGVEVAEWDGQSIADRIGQMGLRGSGADINKVYSSMANAIAKKPSYTLGASTFSGTVTAAADPALLAAVTALGAKIDALPAEIDRYSDGRRQAS